MDEFYRQPPTYRRLRDRIYMVQQRYPQLPVMTIGTSVLGKGIFALVFGRLDGAAVSVGGVHGMEWLTTLCLMRFAEEMLECTACEQDSCCLDLSRALEKRGMVLIPCLNPDGVELSLLGDAAAGADRDELHGLCEQFPRWQANANGVDLNHNFDAGWEILHELERKTGITGPGPTRYGGPCPHSEPESRALVEFCIQNHFRQAYAYHSQGEEIFYKYGERTPASARLIAQLLASAGGYEIVTQTGLASHGGFKDWFIERFGRPAFTIEIGKGSNPLPITDFEPVYEKLRELLFLSLIV